MSLTRTEMGLQAHSAGAALADDREHRQPGEIRPAGRNAFVMAPPLDESGSRAKPWKPSKLAAHLGVTAQTIKNRIYAGHLPALPLGCNRHAIPAHVCLHVLKFGLNAYSRSSAR